MAEKTKNLPLPAQARLAKLKQELKERNKMKLEVSSSKMSPQKKKPVSPKECNKKNQKTESKSTKRGRKKYKTPEKKMHVKSKKPNNSNPVNEASKPSVPQKRKSSIINPEHSPSKLPHISKNPKKNEVLVPELSIGAKIKKELSSFCDKLSYLTGYKQKAKYTIPKKTSSSPPKSFASNENLDINKNLNTNRSNDNSILTAGKMNCASVNQYCNTENQYTLPQRTDNISDLISVKKTPPKTEAGKRNLFKRKNTSILSDKKVSPQIGKKDNKKGKYLRFEFDQSLKNAFKDKIDLTPEDKFSKDTVQSYGYQTKSKLNFSETKRHYDVDNEKTFTRKEKPLSPVGKTYKPYLIGNDMDNLHEDFDMEWEPTKDNLLRFTRNEIDASEDMMDWQDGISENIQNEKGKKCVYFVVDTNVLIRNINLIKQLAQTDLRGHSVIIMIPWQVLKELDKLKSINDQCIARCARRASRFLSESQSNGLNIIFQKQAQHFEDCPQVFVEVPDDHLIKSCCQLINEDKKVILLSNDTNLRVKASATGGFPSVSDEWAAALIQKDYRPKNSSLHCFEKEPAKALEEERRTCSIFLYKLTLCFKVFLYNVLCDIYKNKYGELLIFWLPSSDMTLYDNITCALSLAELSSFKTQINYVFMFYKENNSYLNIKAIDVERLGRNCIKLANSMYHVCPEVGTQFDMNIGFLKTGNLEESLCGYTSACRFMAQNYLKKMEDRLKCSLDHFRKLISKIVSQRMFIPDTKKKVMEIDNEIVITNEASTIFLLLNLDEELPLDCPEVRLFYKVLLNFLEIKTDDFTLPLFSPEDIVIYINQEKSNLYPAALHWLSEVRREFLEFKSILRQH